MGGTLSSSFTKDPGEDRGNKPTLGLVVVGNPRSGKTTFCKRTRMLSGNETLTPEERAETHKMILRNILDTFTELLKLARDEGYPMEEDREIVDRFVSKYYTNVENTQLTDEICKEIEDIWSLASIQKLWKVKGYELQDTVEELIEGFGRMKNGETTFEDYSRTYHRSFGVQQATYSGLLTREVTLEDVCLKKTHLNNRNFWNVVTRSSGVVFMVAANEFGPSRTANMSKSGLEQSLELFYSLLQNDLIARSKNSVVVVFNKTDLLNKHLHEFPSEFVLKLDVEGVKREFEYEGRCIDDGTSDELVFEDITDFLRQTFETLAKEAGVTNLYCYCTTLTYKDAAARLQTEMVDEIFRKLTKD